MILKSINFKLNKINFDLLCPVLKKRYILIDKNN